MKVRKGEKGLSLIDVVIAIGVLGILAVGFLTASRSATTTLIRVDEKETAKNLAETQMEYVKALPFSESYSPMDAPGYDAFTVDIVTSDISERDAGIQNVTVVVEREGREITRLSNYRVK